MIEIQITVGRSDYNSLGQKYFAAFRISIIFSSPLRKSDL